jgi:hypothetical protein
MSDFIARSAVGIVSYIKEARAESRKFKSNSIIYNVAFEAFVQITADHSFE